MQSKFADKINKSVKQSWMSNIA